MQNIKFSCQLCHLLRRVPKAEWGRTVGRNSPHKPHFLQVAAQSGPAKAAHHGENYYGLLVLLCLWGVATREEACQQKAEAKFRSQLLLTVLGYMGLVEPLRNFSTGAGVRGVPRPKGKGGGG